MAVVVVCSVVVDVETAQTIYQNYRMSIHIIYYIHVLYYIIMVNLHYLQPLKQSLFAEGKGPSNKKKSTGHILVM